MTKAYRRTYAMEHFRMCADLLVSAGLCGSHKEFWVEWAGIQGPIPKPHSAYVSLTMRNISMLNGSIGMEALNVDYRIDDTNTQAKSDRLYRQFQALHVARSLVSLALLSEISRN